MGAGSMVENGGLAALHRGGAEEEDVSDLVCWTGSMGCCRAVCVRVDSTDLPCLYMQIQVCAVCGEGHSEDGNQIIFCDQCDLAVHQGCYGVTLIPDKEWCVL